MSVTEQGAIMRDRQAIINIEKKQAEDKVSLKQQRANVMKLEKVIVPKENKMKQLQEIRDMKNTILDQIQRKPEESKALFEKVCEGKQETISVIKTILEERRPLQRELDKTENVLNQYMWFGTILFKLSPSDWQKIQEANTLKVKDTKKELKSEAERTAVGERVETGLASCPETWQSSIVDPMVPSCQSNTVVTKPNVERDDDENEEKLEMYSSDSQQVMDLSMELTDQVLSLIHNSTEVDKILDETIEITINKMKQDEEKLTIQENNIKDRMKEEEKTAAMLTRRIQLHDSLKTEDQDVLLAALGKKVKDVYSGCADSHFTSLSTLEKLCSIENRMTLLLQQIENIPEEVCQMLWQTKDNERKSRLREEKLRLEMEKQKEKMSKCMQRAHGDKKKSTGRKLIPRSKIKKEKILVTEEPVADTVEEVPYADFFSDDY